MTAVAAGARAPAGAGAMSTASVLSPAGALSSAGVGVQSGSSAQSGGSAAAGVRVPSGGSAQSGGGVPAGGSAQSGGSAEDGVGLQSGGSAEDGGNAPALADRVARAGDRFAHAGVGADEAAADAEVLARHVLGWDRATYLARRRDPAPPGFEVRYSPLADRRARREPVSIITGRREFWGLAFAVGPAVLAPRPETELIVEMALELFGDQRGAPLAIADVGTGSGCLAVTLAREFPRAAVTAVDISSAALAVARRNAVAHGVADRIAWIEAPLAGWMARAAPDGGGASGAGGTGRAGGMARAGGAGDATGAGGAGRGGDVTGTGGAGRGGDADGTGDAGDVTGAGRAAGTTGTRFDLLVANLPYVPTGEVASLPPEVRLHEPRVALDGGPDGLGPLRGLLRVAPAGLNPNGRLLVEIGAGQADAFRALVAGTPGLELLDVRADLQGISRTAVIAAGERGMARKPREPRERRPPGRR